MHTKNQLCYDEKQLQLYFIELLYKEELINKETYYNAKKRIHSESENE